MNLCTLTYSGECTDALCAARMWLISMVFYTIMSLLIVKVYRLHKLVGAPISSNNRKNMSNWKVWLYLVPIPLTQLLILTIFTVISPPKATSIVNDNSYPPTQEILCEHDEDKVYQVVQKIFLCVVIG